MSFDLDQLKADTQGTSDLLDGYMLMNQSQKLSAKAHAELGEGIAKVARRNGLLASAVEALEALESDGYPDNPPEIADADVLDEIARVAGGIALVPKDFKPLKLTADGGSVDVKDIPTTP